MFAILTIIHHEFSQLQIFAQIVFTILLEWKYFTISWISLQRSIAHDHLFHGNTSMFIFHRISILAAIRIDYLRADGRCYSLRLCPLDRGETVHNPIESPNCLWSWGLECKMYHRNLAALMSPVATAENEIVKLLLKTNEWNRGCR